MNRDIVIVSAKVTGIKIIAKYSLLFGKLY